MLVTLAGVLDAERVSLARTLLEDGSFRDGRESAGEQAGLGKHNEELDSASDSLASLNNLVMGSLVQHPVYLNAGLPHRIALPYYSRYREGMFYGPHVDDPVMGQGPDPRARYRCDVAITLFLNDPQEYDGGELAIETSFGPQMVKLAAGDGVMYPASSLHEVRQVTQGQRLAAITWMQSLVPDPTQRELLYRLWTAREELRRQAPEADSTRLVDQSYVNLVRMWTQV